MAGLTPAGLVVKTREDAKAEMEAAYRAKYGPNIDLDPKTSVDGRRIGIQADQIGQIWDVIQAVHAATDPDSAEDQSLDAVCALTGTVREAAAFSTVRLTCTGAPGTSLTAGRVAEVTGTGAQFETDAAATIALVQTWGAGTFALGEVVTNAGNIYRATTGGTSATGPVGIVAGVIEADGGTARWRNLGPGTGLSTTASTATDTGPIGAQAGSIITIKTPVAGWQGVYNELDADLGQDREDNETLRLRRYDELGAADGASFESLRAALLDVVGVTQVRVFFNRSNITDGDGLPPHTVECLVQGGAAQDIREAIAKHTVCTESTTGNTSGTITDSEGHTQTIVFSRADETRIYAAVTLTYDAALYPSDGDAQVKDAVASFGAFYSVFGRDAVSSALKARCFQVPGVLDVTTLFIGTAASPTLETTIPIDAHGLAVYDTSRVTVSSTPGTP